MSRINAIFVFDLDQKPTVAEPSDEEIQEAKLLYYYPEYRSQNEKRSHFGLIEGLIALTGTFTDDNIDFIRSKLFTTTVMRWLKNVYLVVVLKNDGVPSDEKEQYNQFWKNFLLKNVLVNCKRMFELLYGNIDDYLRPKDCETKEGLFRLSTAFSEFLPQFVDFSTKDALHILKDRNAYKISHITASCAVDVQVFADELQQEFESIAELVLIYNGQLVHSSLELDDMLLIYSYLIRYRGDISKDGKKCLKRQFKDSEDLIILDSAEDLPFGPYVFIRGQKYRLAVLCLKELFLVLLLGAEDFLLTVNSIREYVEKMVQGLSQIEEKLSKAPALKNMKTVSLNRVRKTVKSIGYDDINGARLDELAVVHGIHSLIKFSAEEVSCVHLKNSKIGWISAKVSNGREVYHIADNHRMPLSDIKSHFDKFIKTYLGGIYFV